MSEQGLPNAVPHHRGRRFFSDAQYSAHARYTSHYVPCLEHLESRLERPTFRSYLKSTPTRSCTLVFRECPMLASPGSLGFLECNYKLVINNERMRYSSTYMYVPLLYTGLATSIYRQSRINITELTTASPTQPPTSCYSPQYHSLLPCRPPSPTHLYAPSSTPSLHSCKFYPIANLPRLSPSA